MSGGGVTENGAGQTSARHSGPGRAIAIALAVVAAAVVAAVAVAGNRADEVPTIRLTEPGMAFDGPLPLDERAPPPPERPLPDFSLASLGADGTVEASDYRGRPLVINFWATWCAPCVDEMPLLAETARRLRDDVAFLGVNVRDNRDEAVALAGELGVGYDLAADPSADFATDMGLFGMPTTLFVDDSGTVVHTVTGPLESDQLDALLAEHLGIEPTGA